MKIKQTYLLFLIVIGLVSLATYSTFALFTASTEITDVVDFTTTLSTNNNMLEYEMITVPAGESKIIELNITNSYQGILYYGAWYEMVTPTNKTDDIKIGINTKGNSAPSSGQIEKDPITLLIGITNDTNSEIIVNIGVKGKIDSNLEITGSRNLITDEWTEENYDIKISKIRVEGFAIPSVLLEGNQTVISGNCDNISYDIVGKRLKVNDFTSKQDCVLTITPSTDKNNYPLLNTMKVGDYVEYVGNNGCLNGEEGTTGERYAESGNSCKGENANQSIDNSGYTYGYCSSPDYKFYVYGWRIAYIEDGKVHLISAGSPECNGLGTINGLSNAALDYCNATYVDGGVCSSSNTWAMGNSDFEKITSAISGVSSSLASCESIFSMKKCGYNNNLIDNGGYYWFEEFPQSDVLATYDWHPAGRTIKFGYLDGYKGLRPIIQLSNNVYVTGGTGTMEDPYKIEI